MRFAMCIAAFVCFVTGSLGATTFVTDPANGALTGAPGDVVGWGFTMTNNTDWLIVTQAAFCVGTGHTAADLGDGGLHVECVGALQRLPHKHLRGD